MFRPSKITELAGGILILFLCAVGFAQQPPQTTGPQTEKKITQPVTPPLSEMNKINSTDKSFITKAAEGGAAEVTLGKLAIDKASDEAVKTYAKRIMEDHNKANQELSSIAQTKGVTLPADSPSKQKKISDRFAKLSGAEFDREYIKAMIKDHQKDISLFERYSRDSKDPEVRAFIDRTLPTLRDHKQLALDTAKKVGVEATAEVATEKPSRQN
jgi:putative membrane protein